MVTTAMVANSAGTCACSELMAGPPRQAYKNLSSAAKPAALTADDISPVIGVGAPS